MKKLVLAIVAMAMAGCATTTVHQVELYGVVDDVVILNGHKHAKVWCWKQQKYYRVVSDKTYQIGDTIKIK
jgi:predicted porin